MRQKTSHTAVQYFTWSKPVPSNWCELISGYMDYTSPVIIYYLPPTFLVSGLFLKKTNKQTHKKSGRLIGSTRARGWWNYHGQDSWLGGWKYINDKIMFTGGQIASWWASHQTLMKAINKTILQLIMNSWRHCGIRNCIFWLDVYYRVSVLTRILPCPSGRIFLALKRHLSFSCGKPTRPRPGENTAELKST